MSLSFRRPVSFVALAAALGLAGCGGGSNTADSLPLQLKTLSSRPDLVSGGDTLVEVKAPKSIDVSRIKVLAGARDVTSSFGSSPTGALVGRVSDLPAGSTTIDAQILDAYGSATSVGKLTVVNHAITGPVFSGPHETPFVCNLTARNLGRPLDADCSASTDVSYRYWSTAGSFKNFDPNAPLPTDLAKTQTTQGKSVDFVVRLERGTINRAVYEIAFLHQPGTPLPDPWTSTDGWNGRLRYNFGGGCGGGHYQGDLALVIGNQEYPLATALDKDVLARGYAVATSTLNVAANNCSTVLSAETLSMVKEYFIEKFGTPVWTVGFGGSGGAVQQFEIAQSYPGLLDGLSPGVSFPSMIEAHTIFSDCKLLRTYFTGGATMPWSDEQKRAATGYAVSRTCDALGVPGSGLGATMVEATSCPAKLPAGLAFHPVNNPNGVRCSQTDTFLNVYGRDPATLTVRRPLDNVGVQYGLAAVKQGTISFDQFLELNEMVGGFNVNGDVQPARHVANTEALRTAYQTGRVLVGANLDAVPIISTRGYNDLSGDLHERTRDFQIRAKLDELFGNHDNHVLLIAAPGNNQGAAAMLDTQIIVMEKWLDAIAADPANESRAQKVKRNKPATAKDACWLPDNTKVEEPASFSSTGACNTAYKPYLDPRSAAGAPLSETALKCQLKPVNVTEYGATLTATQTARLNFIFANGVCDYSKPGVEQQLPSRFWAKF